MQYKCISFSKRKEIERRYKNGDRVADIASFIGVTPGALYREIKKGYTKTNSGEPILDENYRPAYSATVAQRTTQENVRRRGRPLKQ